MSGSKNTSVSIEDGAEVLGQTILTLLAIPAGAIALTYYTGKVLVEGAIAGGQLAAQGIENYNNYKNQKRKERQEQLERRIEDACNNLNSQIERATRYCDSILSTPFMNDNFAQSAVEAINQIASRCSSNLSLEKALQITQELDNKLESLKARQNAAVACQQERSRLYTQIEQMRKMIQSQSDIPPAPELDKLNEFEKRLNATTIETFSIVKADFSNWAIDLTRKIKSVQESVKVNAMISSLWSSLPVSQDVAQQYDPVGYSELKRIESHLASQPQPEVALRFQKNFAQHKAAVEVRKRQEEEREAERERLRKIYEPKLEVLTQRLELANSEIVNRWVGVVLINLRRMLDAFKENLALGNVQTMDSDLDSWNETYTNMLTEAGLKQRAEERRQYLVEALRTELPKMGFDIQSLSSAADATSDTVIKVVPRIQKGGKKQRITISVPQAANELVNYRFDGYDLKCSRVDGRPIEENDTGKQTVQDIAEALLPYGIVMSEPDWQGNPDRIHKNADSLPEDNNPAQSLDASQSAAQYRSLDLDD